MKITKAQFEKEVNAFWSWTSHEDRNLTSWFLSLEVYASRMARLALKREVPKLPAEDKK